MCFFVIIGECSWFIILCFSETQLRMPNQHKYFYTINYRFTKYHSIKYNMINLWKKAWNIETILVTSSYWLQKQEERLLQQSWPSQTQSAYYCVTTSVGLPVSKTQRPTTRALPSSRRVDLSHPPCLLSGRCTCKSVTASAIIRGEGLNSVVLSGTWE